MLMNMKMYKQKSKMAAGKSQKTGRVGAKQKYTQSCFYPACNMANPMLFGKITIK